MAQINPEQYEVISLPDVPDIREMWEALGFPWEEARPHPEGGLYAPGRHLEGVYKRLGAALHSIERRGTDHLDFQVGPRAGTHRRFLWESRRGVWTRRHWRVQGQVEQTGGDLVVKEVTIEVESSARKGEWTRFEGSKALNSLLEERLNWVIAQFGARLLHQHELVPEGWEVSPLTDEEVEAYHDLHTSPVAAWSTPKGRVLFEDDNYGSAYLHAEEESRRRLLEIGLTRLAFNADLGWPAQPSAEPAEEPMPDWERELLGIEASEEVPTPVES